MPQRITQQVQQKKTEEKGCVWGGEGVQRGYFNTKFNNAWEDRWQRVEEQQIKGGKGEG